MYKIPTILSNDELLDKCFHKASKISENPKIKNKVIRKRLFIIAKLDAVTDTLDSVLNKYISTFPSFDQVHEFEFDLINTTIGIDRLRKSLGAIDWGRKKVQSLRGEIIKKVKRTRQINQYSKLEEYRRVFYGRVTSILKQISSDLEFLNNARNKLKSFPAIDPELTTVVVAGAPNVGKSLIVKQLSSGKPKVASYPFTTQQLNLGHLTIDHIKLQVIDTPGLLDRSLEHRNKIELQAIMALKHLADIILFILDPSEHCGYSIEEQYRLLEELKRLFSNTQIIPIENKKDLHQSKTDLLKVSAINGQGISELTTIIQNFIPLDST